jgi:uncharacterized membrane protein YsdA (DUF1294 family)/cold shock CspA family protein
VANRPRYQGHLTRWNDTKGFGFVTPTGGGDEAFVHITAFADRRRRPTDGDLITYTILKDSKNRFKAADIRYSGEPQTAARPAGLLRYGLAAILIVPFACVVVALTVLGRTHPLVPLAYVLASGLTFIIYGFDKLAAMNDRRRTGENTLHVMSLLGGWPGALVAQQLFRHKSKKAAFRSVFWITALLNCAVLVWSATDSGASVIRATIGVNDTQR